MQWIPKVLGTIITKYCIHASTVNSSHSSHSKQSLRCSHYSSIQVFKYSRIQLYIEHLYSLLSTLSLLYLLFSSLLFSSLLYSTTLSLLLNRLLYTTLHIYIPGRVVLCCVVLCCILLCCHRPLLPFTNSISHPSISSSHLISSRLVSL